MLSSGRSFSIRSVLLVALLGQIWLILALAGWLWSRAGDQVVQDIRVPLLDEVASRVELRVSKLVAEPKRINKLNAEAFRSHILPLRDPQRVVDYFQRQLRSTPTISTVLVGLETDELVSIERVGDGEIELVEKIAGPPAPLVTSRLDEDGRRTYKKERPNYVTRIRPWYTAAAKAGGPTWSEIYSFFVAEVRLSITAVRPVFDDVGDFVGVLGSDLNLSLIGDFLRTMRVGKTGHVFIMERDGRMIASSTRNPLTRDKDAEERLKAFEFGNPRVRAAAEHLAAQPGGLEGIAASAETRFELDGETMLVRVWTIEDKPGIDWIGVIVVPRSDFTGPIDENTRTTWMLFAGLLLVAGLTIMITSRLLTRSIYLVSDDMRRVAEFDIPDRELEPSRFAEIERMQRSMVVMNKALRSFGKYVPKPIVRGLMVERREAVLGVEPTDVTVLFSDLAGYTTLCESTPPGQLIEILRLYFEAFDKAVTESGGTIVEYIGDAVVAFWNTPQAIPEHQRAAVTAAMTVHGYLDALNADFAARGWPQLTTRIGVHTARSRVGNIGARNRMKFTAVGDMMNLCARLESINKVYGTRLLVSDALHAATDDHIVYRMVDDIVVKGRVGSTRIYEPLATAEEATADVRARAERYEAAMRLYLDRDFAAARDAFDDIVRDTPHDGAARRLRSRCEEYIETPPPDGWTGAYAWKTK